MNIILLALVVGVLFACGTFLIMRRSPIRLVLGLGLLSHGVNLLLFSTSSPLGGSPPVIADKAAFNGDVAGMVDPLPQALILTAIVISFGVTAFTVVLINRRDSLSQPATDNGDYVPSDQVIDPFAPPEYYFSGLDQESDDYEWLEYSMAGEYRSAMNRRKKQLAKQGAAQGAAGDKSAPPPKKNRKNRKKMNQGKRIEQTGEQNGEQNSSANGEPTGDAEHTEEGSST